ncbi:MAG: xanthine dehydrogenase family protein molybdopterin-binding subunit [Xanthobacteraceae bacterium]|nr:xanthine dehydrogenase family protein molybdopterin-binding subunit [Xanthobacteraceae bacterium]
MNFTIRFGSDAGAQRSEDEPLVTGQGQFTDDINLPGQAFAAFLRAPVGHAKVNHVDTSEAQTMPGVIGIYTGADLIADGLGNIPPVAIGVGRNGKPMIAASMPPLVHDRIRYAGEPAAIVVADSLRQALDAAEKIEIDYELLESASHVNEAISSGAERLHENAPGNLAIDWTDGDAKAIENAFAKAAHIETVLLEDTRVAAVAMEPRAAIGQWDAKAEKYTLTASTQGVAVIRKLLAEGVFKVPLEKIRVLTPDVGGGFGMKAQTYPEYAVLLYAARKTGRPVKWRATRVESFLADSHGRDGVLEGDMAFDKEGKILGFRVRNKVGIGAYTTQYAAIFSTMNTKNCLSSVYRIPAIAIDVKMVFTNAAPLGPYRGAGRPEAIYLIERLLDNAARKMNVDRIEIRRKNLIPPDAMPYKTPNGPIYDSGEFEKVLDKALALSDWNGFEKRREQSSNAGKLRGIGICCFLEVAGGILNEKADLRFDADGTAAIRLGVQAMGQGHLSTLPRVVANRLGIDISKVKLIEGDSDEVPDGTPSVASRSLMMAGSASAIACDDAIAKGRKHAAQMFGVGEETIEYKDGDFRVPQTNHVISLLDLARRSPAGQVLPPYEKSPLNSLSEFVSPQMSFPNGCHVCEVEIEPETGAVSIAGYAAVDDVGNIIHETIVDGQMHGGIAQGLGQVLGEHIQYSDGQLINASLMDYFVPRADSVPMFKTAHHSVPCTTNPIGVKGAGESGVAGSLPSGIAAVIDALSVYGVEHFDLPASPSRIWAAINEKRP